MGGSVPGPSLLNVKVFYIATPTWRGLVRGEGEGSRRGEGGGRWHWLGEGSEVRRGMVAMSGG